MLMKVASAIDTAFFCSGDPNLPKVTIALLFFNEIRSTPTGGGNVCDSGLKAEKPEFTLFTRNSKDLKPMLFAYKSCCIVKDGQSIDYTLLGQLWKTRMGMLSPK